MKIIPEIAEVEVEMGGGDDATKASGPLLLFCQQQLVPESSQHLCHCGMVDFCIWPLIL